MKPLETVPAPQPEVAGVHHSQVNVRGVRLHVAQAGTGEPVVLLHGFPQHWYGWRRLIPLLSERYRLICVDQRGFGWSDAPARGYDTDSRVADIIGLLDALGLDRVRLIGHDWGRGPGSTSVSRLRNASGTSWR
ncbi:alpha/beta hydrolase family protein [Streptomyces sp. BK208]|uniref:alpha/beta fold hydrolase n=1 Tax=Streptomyces sp. BK208 TaxID=2512150 RepID=UPI0010D2266B|nr:alpha/beta fold hydrolase [Streptomyces sp. BK208]TDT24448.1 alpha/beta hydrolase family protein [Streptomyces sp. BK208]